MSEGPSLPIEVSAKKIGDQPKQLTDIDRWVKTENYQGVNPKVEVAEEKRGQQNKAVEFLQGLFGHKTIQKHPQEKPEAAINTDKNLGNPSKVQEVKVNDTHKPEMTTSTFETAKTINDIFTRDDAIKRSEIALRNLGNGISEESWQKFQRGELQKIEFNGNTLEVWQSSELWYGLLYDAASQRYHYIGLDGSSVAVDSSPGMRLAVQFMDVTLLPHTELVGNTDEVYDSVTKITDAAVASLPAMSERFEINNDLQIHDLSEETLGTLSESEYNEFIKKLSGHFAVHLVRFGVRNVQSGFHDLGQGKYFDAMHEVLQAKMLRSSYDVMEDEGTSTGKIYAEEGVIQENRSRSIHVSPELIDLNYAGEENIEPFIWFPAEALCENYNFSGNMNFNPDETGGYANWELTPRNNEKQAGMSINDGIVFLPSETQVDPQTGSQFEVVNNEGVVDERRLVAFENVIERRGVTPDEEEKLRSEFYENDFFSERNVAPTDKTNLAIKKADFHQRLTRLLSKYGFDEELTASERERILIKMQEWRAGYDSWKDIGIGAEYGKSALHEAGILYKHAQTTISSKEYWERWLEDHPESRPAHVFYYAGEPDTAIINYLLDKELIAPDDIEKKYGKIKLKARDEKLHIPSQMYPDIGNFNIHEAGNWMYRLSQSVD